MAGDDEELLYRENERKRFLESTVDSIRTNFVLPQFDYSSRWNSFVSERTSVQEKYRQNILQKPYLDGWLEVYYYEDTKNKIHLELYSYDSCTTYIADLKVMKWADTVDSAVEYLLGTLEKNYPMRIQEHRDEVYIESGFVIH